MFTENFHSASSRNLVVRAHSNSVRNHIFFPPLHHETIQRKLCGVHAASVKIASGFTLPFLVRRFRWERSFDQTLPRVLPTLQLFAVTSTPSVLILLSLDERFKRPLWRSPDTFANSNLKRINLDETGVHDQCYYPPPPDGGNSPHSQRNFGRSPPPIWRGESGDP